MIVTVAIALFIFYSIVSLFNKQKKKKLETRKSPLKQKQNSIKTLNFDPISNKRQQQTLPQTLPQPLPLPLPQPLPLSPSIFKKYQPASNKPSLKTIQLSNSTVKAQRDFLSVLDTSRISLEKLDTSVELMRIWLSRYVLAPLVKKINIVNQTFIDNGIPHLACGYIGPINGMTLTELYAKHSTLPIVRDRILIDEYLNFIGIRHDKCIQRIKELAKGGCLAAFIWDHEGDYSLSDSRLVMLLFVKYIDTLSLNTFSTGYFNDFGDSCVKKLAHIETVSKSPPCFGLVVDSESWEIPPGRNNLFQVLVLFINHYKNFYGGYIGLLDLSGKSISLTDVLQAQGGRVCVSPGLYEKLAKRTSTANVGHSPLKNPFV